MKALAELRQGLENTWDFLFDGWRRLRESAADAVTRFQPGDKSSLPAQVGNDV
jgi:HSP20 family protein